MSLADRLDEELGSDDVLADAKAFLSLSIAADSSREKRLDDMRFLRGDTQWPDQIRRARELDKRPCLTVNKLPTFLHQVTNDLRANTPSITVSPVAQADKATAEVVQGMIRHMEYASNADTAYDTSVSHAAACGVGYFRLITDYCDPKSMDQEIKFRRVRNGFTVYFDPTAQEADGSDQRRCAIGERMTKERFERKYPKAEVTTQGFDRGCGDPSLRNWIGADFIMVLEFYRIEETPATLIQLSTGETGYEDELEVPPGAQIVNQRETTRSKTMWYRITALEVIESTEVKCKWIPVFPVYGDELDIDGEIDYSGVTRNAKDPAMMYNFWMTAATEEVGLRPKTPYIGAVGQFEGQEDDWNQANVRNFSTLEYNPITVDGVIVPPPQRQPMADIPSGMLQMANIANDNIKATTGLFDASLGARGTARSGVQEREQRREGDVANSHFADNLVRAIRHAGRCIVDMIPGYYDGQRVVKIMGEDGKIASAEINKLEKTQDEQGNAIDRVLNDMSIGEFAVVVKAGPSYSTLREEAADAMIEFGKAWPKLMDVAGDQIVRSMDWPGSAKIADRIAKTLPPELRDKEEGDDENVIQTAQGPVPIDQVPNMLAQMQQQIQQMQQALQEASSGIAKAKVEADAKMQTTQLDAQMSIQKAQIDADARVKVAQINATSANDVAELTGMIKLLVEKMQPPPALVDAAMTDGNADGQIR